MDTLAYYHCRSVNPKSDHPRMGYHAMSEDQRDFLRERQREAAEEILRMVDAGALASPVAVDEARLADVIDSVGGCEVAGVRGMYIAGVVALMLDQPNYQGHDEHDIASGFDRMIAEVKRAAKEKAWGEGFVAGTETV
jgi:hypothetical protein